MPAYLVAARRTAVVPVQGAFKTLSLGELASPVVAALLADAGLQGAAIDQVIIGNALAAGGNPARLVALAAGLPESCPALSLDSQCCSGLDALRVGAAMIASGQAQVVLAGGVESTSRRPLRAHRPLRSHHQQQPMPGAPSLAFYERPAFTPWPERDPEMAQAAADLAWAWAIDAEQQADWTLASHAKALAAEARMQPSLVVLADQCRDAAMRSLSAALVHRSPELASCQGQGLRLANVALQADACALVLMVSAEVLSSLAARDTAVAWQAGLALGAAADSPPLALVPAVRRLLANQGVVAAEVAVVELMEAYAVQALANVQALALPLAAVNAWGGALARGHPIGASGAILAVQAFHRLQHQPAGAQALLAIAAAGGLGSAALLHRTR